VWRLRTQFVVAGFLLLTLAVVYGAFAYLYRSYREQLDTELGQRLVAVATASAAAVSDDAWAGLAAGDTAAVARLRPELEFIRSANDVSDLFFFDARGVTLYDLAGRYPVGAPNLALSLDVVEATSALAGLPEYTELTSQGGVFLKAAYAPVFGADGEILGGVGVEASAAFLDLVGAVRGTLLGAAAAVLVGVVLLGALFVRLVGARAALEARLRRTETLATMGQMASMLAHEIRNPLGIIRGAAERLGKRHNLEGDELFHFIPEEVDRLEQTLGAYLDFARPHRPDGPEDLAAALRRTLDLMGQEWERKGIRLEVDIVDGKVPVRSDPHALQQAFLNVLLNARDAMPEGGTLSVRLAREAGRGVVRFTDTGIGMSDAVRRRADEPFFTGKESGSGLGLAVVRRIVDGAQGRLEIESVQGRGTAVTLAFPLAG
jgi:signal transduction histidine kinase